VAITNCTISGNTATASGGGIFNDDVGTITLANSTISSNTATTSGGGIFNNGGTATLKNTIVANSTTGGDCAGTALASNGNNLDSDGTCGLAAAGDLPNTDPQLGPLADNGGPTQTHALLTGSPAIDAGNDAACPVTDRRGVARPIDGDEDGTATCDMGAYEFEPPLLATPTPTPTPSPTLSHSPTSAATLTATATPTPEAGPSELPSVGGEPVDGSSFLWLLLAVDGIVVLSGGLVLARQVRRIR
jgi:parallel beta-helix repeat protein